MIVKVKEGGMCSTRQSRVDTWVELKVSNERTIDASRDVLRSRVSRQR